MKTIFFTTLFALIIVECNKPEKHPDYKNIDGFYEGYLAYQGINYFHVMGLDNKKYKEYYPGGVYYQNDQDVILLVHIQLKAISLFLSLTHS
jgi:hypothetical protein